MITNLTFAPDADQTAPGVISDCAMLVPSMRGYKAAPSAVSAVIEVLSSTCRGAAGIRRLDGSKRIIAGTQTKLYEVSGSTWNDISRAGDYTGGAENRWRLAQFGNVTIAVNRTDETQYSLTGAFADLPGAPRAALVETASGFAILGNYDDGTDAPHGWYCSALRDYTDWTPSIATQCANGLLLDSPGDIRALKRLGADCVAYKERSIYLGRYVGPPYIWEWPLIPGEVGAANQESVVSIETAHFFIGYEDFYVFDGSRPVALGSPLKQWFFKRLDPQYRHLVVGVHDRNNSSVMWYYAPNGSGGLLTECVVYNYKINKWGRADRSIDAALEYQTTGITYDELGTYYATYHDLPDVAYDSAFWVSDSPEMAIIDTSHALRLLVGVAGSSSLTTGDMGSDDAFTLVDRVTPKYAVQPTTATMTNYYRDTSGGALVTDQTVTLSNGRADVIRSARWHRFTLNFTGDMEITAINVRGQPDGEN